MSVIFKVIYRFYRRFIKPDYLKMLKRRGLFVGKGFRMMENVYIDPSHCWHITIGDNVTISPGVYIFAHDASTKRFLGYTRIGKVQIGDRVFIGSSAIILPGVIIGSDVVIGAGSVVTHDVPNGSVAVGNPAEVVESLDSFLKRRRAEMERVPRFGDEYTLRRNVGPAMKAEMNDKMKDRIGYIV
ncbi:MAG: hypothetical protein B6D63_04150 [Candidatus Latescibacteria bacterium 4484_7]|nr:MAG: hypothetical protein B6D63_04150 [Candidatus Latescibacteria bacterium 4484_7]RKZ08005.1 MAG: acyltransferase [bacterium]